jgi:RES domain-containing protein
MLFRIGSSANTIFSSVGAWRNGGRWNSVGKDLIYCTENVSCARLEVEGHLGIRLPPLYKLVEILVPEDLKIEELEPFMLPSGWDNKSDLDVSRSIGDAWIDKGDSLLLRTPSIASPLDYCVVINPKHHDFARLIASEPIEIVWPKAGN